MGKISKLPEQERLEIIGYLAQEGVIKEITAEVPLRKSDDFQSKYGIKPYIIRSDKKYSDQLRIYLTDPDSAPPQLKAALDTKIPRLNDNEFIRDLVDNYGFTFFSKQNSQVIIEKAKAQLPNLYDAFLRGYNTNGSFIEELIKAVHLDTLPEPVLIPVSDDDKKMKKKKRKPNFPDSNAQFTDDQLLLLGWAGEEYLFKYLESGSNAVFIPFGIEKDKVKDVLWFNKGYDLVDNWVDGSIGQGCDILIKTEDQDYYIEVKSSKRQSPIFGMTSLEMQKMMDMRAFYYLVKIDFMENLLTGDAPQIKIYKDPFDRFFMPMKMQKATFYCY